MRQSFDLMRERRRNRVFNRDYRYARERAAFDEFRTGSFANAAYRDLKASGRLESLR